MLNGRVNHREGVPGSGSSDAVCWPRIPEGQYFQLAQREGKEVMDAGASIWRRKSCPALLQQPAAIRGKAGKIDEALFLVEENAVWDSWHRALEQVVPPGLHSLIALICQGARSPASSQGRTRCPRLLGLGQEHGNHKGLGKALPIKR